MAIILLCALLELRRSFRHDKNCLFLRGRNTNVLVLQEFSSCYIDIIRLKYLVAKEKWVVRETFFFLKQQTHDRQKKVAPYTFAFFDKLVSSCFGSCELKHQLLKKILTLLTCQLCSQRKEIRVLLSHVRRNMYVREAERSV